MSFFYENGQMVIEYQGRRVATTEGRLLQFVSEEQEFTTDIAFPDANKGQLYTWSYGTNTGPTSIGYYGNCRTAVGARPQEWSNDVVLASAPTGADLWVGRAMLTHTKAPSHTWLGQTLSPAVPEGAEIQLWGSMVVEIGPGISRGLTVDIVDGQLLVRLAHSVGPAAGNFTTYGTVPPQASQFNGVQFSGIQNQAVGGAALPVFWREGSPYSKTFSGQTGGLSSPDRSAAVSICSSYNRGGANAAVYDDPTDYSSIYTLTVRGRFGRRS
ncbi:hypothetical protein ACFOOL_06810 [Devosia honganensis]|uniref:Tail fiber protein n=1 Tax=Devosia honganensis TaxID=1610527 RepID=A0ABV7X0Y8_9HYPH